MSTSCSKARRCSKPFHVVNTFPHEALFCAFIVDRFVFTSSSTSLFPSVGSANFVIWKTVKTSRRSVRFDYRTLPLMTVRECSVTDPRPTLPSSGAAYLEMKHSSTWSITGKVFPFGQKQKCFLDIAECEGARKNVYGNFWHRERRSLTGKVRLNFCNFSSELDDSSGGNARRAKTALIKTRSLE